jgi:hypothetical protein
MNFRLQIFGGLEAIFWYAVQHCMTNVRISAKMGRKSGSLWLSTVSSHVTKQSSAKVR